jgi:hypothetical protein
MKQAASLVFALVLLGLPACRLVKPIPYARSTDIELRRSSSEVISPTRRIDWTQAGVLGGIPDRANGTCATLGPSATASDVNSAIAACVNGVVFLKTGTYRFSSGITFKGSSNVTLRGAGPEQTILTFTGSDPCGGYPADICIQGSDIWSGNVAAGNIRQWIGGYDKGANDIVLDSAAGLAIGSVIILDQLNDTADTGGVMVGDAIGQFSLDSGAPGRKNRAQQQFVRVTAIERDRVRISPGLYMPNWRASQQPQVWWWGETAFLNGVEDLTVDHSQSSEMSGIVFHNAYNGWVKNIKSLNAKRNHVWLNQAARVEVRDSYFYGTKDAASQSYGVESFTTSDGLVLNNIFQHVTTPIMVGSSAGSVFAYNFVTDMSYATPTWMMAGIIGGHDAGTGMNLFEGNVANQFSMDLFHGTGSLATLFRNQLTGTELGKTQWANTIPINIWAFNRFINVVGNILGTSRYHRTYENSVSPLAARGRPERAIFVLGFSGSSEQQPLGNDPLVIATMLRWGNYDYATNDVRWNPEEIPPTEPVPATRALPASLFLSAKPPWWGSMPWPAIGPDVTGGRDSAGHAHKIPAQVCFESSSRSTGGTLVFDANACYSASI